MFNKQSYNTGLFNTIELNSAISMIEIDTNQVNALKIIRANGESDINIVSDADATIVKYDNGNTNIVFENYANGTKVFIVLPEVLNIEFSTIDVLQTLEDEKIIFLENINLSPGDKLVINTCDMTITLNGENAMKYFDNDSEFFKFLEGINKLIYEDNSDSRDISINATWKDKWK